jgi:DNA-binding transcriptional LysR family regulator
MDITPRHIEQIEALHRYGSFRRAAEKLCISQPALSRSILLLEEKLGVKFFDRAQGKLLPTQYCRIVLNRGETVLKEMQLLHRDITMLQGGMHGILNIGCGPIPAETLAGDAIARFNNLYPQVTVRLIIDHVPKLTTLLHSRSIDFFVAEAQHFIDKQEYEFVPMPQQQGYFCCRQNHPLTARSSLTFNDILEFPMALMWLSERIFTIFSKLSGKNIQKNEDLAAGYIECDNMNTLLCIVNGCDAVTMTSREILTGSGYKDKIHLLPLVIPSFRSGYSLVSLKEFSTIPAIAAMKNCFLETAAQKVQPN